MEDENFPVVSIIIPCRNEERYISKCLDSIIAQDYSKDELDVLVVDGMSKDGTREIVKEYIQKCPFMKLLDNPRKVVPTALNIGIKEAKGEIIMPMGAHSVYDKNYISKCIKYLKKYNVDNVGGILVTLPGASTILAKSIASVLSHPFGVGNSYFRIGSKKPRFVDTVPFGCYKREVFEKIGLCDEELIRNQDDEFNFRLARNGGKILLIPEIVSYYYARSKLSQVWRQYFQYGYFKVRVAQKIGAIPSWRQLIPAIFVGSLIFAAAISFFTKFFLWVFLFVIGLYTVTNFLFSLSISIKKKEFALLPFLMVSFTTLHFSYGFGYLRGIWDFIVSKKHLKKGIEGAPLTR